MITNILLFVLLAGVLVFGALDVRQTRINKRRSDQFLDGLITEMRAANLRMMKALKGESYLGNFGDMDVHTDSAIPGDMISLQKWEE